MATVLPVYLAQGRTSMLAERRPSPRPTTDSLRPALLPLLAALRPLPQMTVVVGTETSGNPLLLNLANPATWHLYVCGPERCGKSELLRVAVVGLGLGNPAQELRLVGVDLGGRELTVLEGLPHALADVATGPVEASRLLMWLGDEAERRACGTGAPDHIVLVVDDLGVLRALESASTMLDHLAAAGLRSRIHILAAGRGPGERGQSELPRWPGLVHAFAGFETGTFTFDAGDEVVTSRVARLGVADLHAAARITWARAGGA